MTTYAVVATIVAIGALAALIVVGRRQRRIGRLLHSPDKRDRGESIERRVADMTESVRETRSRLERVTYRYDRYAAAFEAAAALARGER